MERRLAPPDLVEALREIDPDADLVHLGRDRWVLGTWRPSRPLAEAGVRRLRALARRAQGAEWSASDIETYRLARLQLDGFRPLRVVRWRGLIEASPIVYLFRRAHWRWQHLSDAEAWREWEGDDPPPPTADPDLAKEAWKLLVRRSFLVPGLRTPERPHAVPAAGT